ncbi:Chondroitin sulfate N-acetylgalactosaminyltransferase 1 [Frankliniella fusca]|uniref:Chondroitin sulfate N-acetylgalactosaminyltransferase 1 n=1 Tax=Frankliniella fusca TaxID=407009 RepID=A0AAE1GX39_9NEOP|nr:Chondroitin sulfate N-acetylgalactosaminyltransferase 1 [Frankliniella fusca]
MSVTDIKIRRQTKVFVDGTEKRLFRKPKSSQIYVISTVWRYKVITMLRAIMQRRTEAAYDVLMNFLKLLMPNFRPLTVKCDFEDAQINAWRNAFPNVSVEGCLWHYDVFAPFRNFTFIALLRGFAAGDGDAPFTDTTG